MLELWHGFLGAQGFMPHGHCYLWRPDVLWLNVGSDAVIALSYYSIPLSLLTFHRKRRDVQFAWLLLLFSAFIFACGATHLMEIVTTWTPLYRLAGLLKLATAAVSAVTAIVIWPLVPKAVALPSPAQLKAEIEERTKAQARLVMLNDELEARVAQRTKELAQSNEDLRAFASSAAHDLREPLRAASRFGRLLLSSAEGQLDANGRAHLAHVLDATDRMGRLLDDLHAFSTALVSDLESVDVSHALKHAELALAGQLEGVSLTAEELPRVLFPKGQMERVLTNLISNATKYRFGESAHVHVRIEREHIEPGFVCISVCDDGLGVPPEFAAEIFEPFRRLHTQKEHPGSGLGLAICKRVVERAGGKIWMRDNLPRGSVFSFTARVDRPV